MMGLLMVLRDFLKLQHNHIQHVKFGLNFQTQKLDNTQEWSIRSYMKIIPPFKIIWHLSYERYKKYKLVITPIICSHIQFLIQLVGESTLRCYNLDVCEFIFHSLKIFNSSLFQLIRANDEMGFMLRMNSYIKTLC
jgi:hypothetical protein